MWRSLRERNQKALIPYVTPDYPVKGSTAEFVLALEGAGVACVEIGLPYSDPLADGPVIQQASQIALRNGAGPMRVLEIVREIRRTSDMPILLMGYVNPVLRHGADNFLRNAADAGIDGMIIPDLPPQEATHIHRSATERGLSMVYLIAPTTNNRRMRMIDARSTDFSYCVSMAGVTGASSRFADSGSLTEFMGRVGSIVTKPFVVGFGISTHADVRRVWKAADGAVVGSQLLRRISNASTTVEVVNAGTAFIEELLSDVTRKDEVV